MTSTDWIIKIVYDQVKKRIRDNYGKGIDIRNRDKELFDWEKEELE